jgi:ABC-type proline/glycine betaine transport system substrate-binding protein
VVQFVDQQVLARVEERRAADARQDLLIHELNHRVKNTLATVQSMARQSEAALRAVWRAIDCTVARVFFTRWFSSWISRSWRGEAVTVPGSAVREAQAISHALTAAARALAREEEGPRSCR